MLSPTAIRAQISADRSASIQRPSVVCRTTPCWIIRRMTQTIVVSGKLVASAISTTDSGHGDRCRSSVTGSGSDMSWSVPQHFTCGKRAPLTQSDCYEMNGIPVWPSDHEDELWSYVMRDNSIVSFAHVKESE